MKIFMLHDVRSFNPDFFPERYSQHSFLTNDEFLRGINRICTSIAQPSELLQLAKIHSSSDIILTFDDGLKDHLWVAEVLASMGISAIFFIPFGVIDKKLFINSHLIQFLNASGYRGEIEKYISKFLASFGLTENVIKSYYVSRWTNNIWSDQEVFITRSLREALSGTLRQEMINYLVSKYLPISLDELHTNLYLNFSDVERISNLGHIIGSHGYLSLDLRFEDDATRYNELDKSFAYLNQYSDHRFISYPNGGFSSEIREIATKIGYNIGFGTLHQDISFPCDVLNMPRLDGTKLDIFV
jgi:peptidoglycan/xylan/chitin deacetylase (PgdA/CDA1 family)